MRIGTSTGLLILSTVAYCGGLGFRCGYGSELNADLAKADGLEKSTPIDLSSALRLAGVQNLQLVVAQQRVEAAVAAQQLAAAQILPSINVGTNYDSHTGVLQRASGNILTVNRSALYIGAGANAVAAGSVGIPGLQYNLNISQTIYNRLASRQLTNRSQFERLAAENAVLLDVALAYTDLLNAAAARSLAILARNDSREIARLTAEYAKNGEGRQADADRAAIERQLRDQDVLEAEDRVGQTSRRLCELLNVDPSVRLRPHESQAVPEPGVPMQIPLAELLAIALLERPELQAQRSAIEAAFLELDSAKVLPFSPTMLLGFSGGAFGGGSDVNAATGKPRFGDFDGRTDFDLVLYWSLRNLSAGNKALIDVARARLRESQLSEIAVLNGIRQEVADAYAHSHARFAEIDPLARAVQTGNEALQEDMARVRGREGRPIELLDSLRQVARSRVEYLNAIIGFNEAELRLYVALGNPPADTLVRPVPNELMKPKAQSFLPK